MLKCLKLLPPICFWDSWNSQMAVCYFIIFYLISYIYGKAFTCKWIFSLNRKSFKHTVNITVTTTYHLIQNTPKSTAMQAALHMYSGLVVNIVRVCFVFWEELSSNSNSNVVPLHSPFQCLCRFITSLQFSSNGSSSPSKRDLKCKNKYMGKRSHSSSIH